MNLWAKLKLILKLNKIIKNFIKEVKEMKPKSGFLTSEFLLAVIGSGIAIFSAVGGLIPADLSAKTVGVAIMTYTIARAIVKFTPSRKDDELLDKVEQIISKQKNS